MTKEAIKIAIIERVENSEKVDYSIWTIGITTRPTIRQEEHGNPKFWHIWEADSLEDANDVEDHFLNEFPKESLKRMSGGTGGDIDKTKTAYVYIY